MRIDISVEVITHANMLLNDELSRLLNVAKKVVEFEYQEEIMRSRLRTTYGDGLKGVS